MSHIPDFVYFIFIIDCKYLNFPVCNETALILTKNIDVLKERVYDCCVSKNIFERRLPCILDPFIFSHIFTILII